MKIRDGWRFYDFKKQSLAFETRVGSRSFLADKVMQTRSVPGDLQRRMITPYSATTSISKSSVVSLSSRLKALMRAPKMPTDWKASDFSSQVISLGT